MMSARRITQTVLWAAMMAVVPAAIGADPALGALRISIVGMRNDDGLVCAAIYNVPESFPKAGKELSKTCGRILKGQALIAFGDLLPGEYAAYAFHDEDRDRALKTNWIGMPKEGVGASRGAKGFMGPPKFGDAKVEVAPGAAVAVRIALKYL